MWTRITDAVFLSGMAVLPKNILSRCVGKLVEIKWPAFIALLLVKGFAKVFGVNLQEVKAPLSSFDSIQSFFIRELKDGARSFPLETGVLGSPCDGTWGMSGRVENGQMLQVKGRLYSLNKLLGGRVAVQDLEGATFSTLYLSPKDYHRFHAPMDLCIQRAWYLPGYLWPVNAAAVRGVDGLFAVNERIVIEVISPSKPDAKMWIVAVGATNVGKIVLGFTDLTSNKKDRKEEMQEWQKESIALKKGDYLGHFCFGSTLVLVMAPEMGQLSAQPMGNVLKLGDTIGKLL